MKDEELKFRALSPITFICYFIVHTLSFLLFLTFPAEAQKKGQQNIIKKMFAKENEDKGPISIDSDQAWFDRKNGTMVYSGNVVVRRGKMRIDSNRLEGFLDENQKEIRRLTLEGEVRVVKEDKTMEAEKATYYRRPGKEEHLELEGDPVIYMQKNSLRADKMIYYHTADRFEAKGKVRAVFHRVKPKPSSRKREKSATPPVPITITSKEADYDIRKNTARFLRNVKVNRNDAHLSAKELEVYLEKEQSKIEKIVASDQVRIVQKNKEITADRGTFYDQERKIVLVGNPVSRQGKNVLSGQEMVYYLDSETVEVKKAKTVLHPQNTKKGGNSFFSPGPEM